MVDQKLDRDVAFLLAKQLAIDARTNETIVGHIAVAKSIAPINRVCLAGARDLVSDFDVCDLEKGALLPDGSFQPVAFGDGGVCLSAAHGARMLYALRDVYAPAAAEELWAIRDRATRRVMLVLTRARPAAVAGTPVRREVKVVLPIRDLVQLLGGRNAAFAERLEHSDLVNLGDRGLARCKLSRKTYVESINELDVLEWSIPWEGFGSKLLSKKYKIGYHGVRIPRGQSFYIQLRAEVFILEEPWKQDPPTVFRGACIIGRGKSTPPLNRCDNFPGLTDLQILLGFYTTDVVAECGFKEDRWLIGLHYGETWQARATANEEAAAKAKKGMKRAAAELKIVAQANDPMKFVQEMCAKATDECDRLENAAAALVVHVDGGGGGGGQLVVVGPQAGPSSARPWKRRSAVRGAVVTRQTLRDDANMNCEGEYHRALQDDDPESKEAEAAGVVDAQYAASDDPHAHSEDYADRDDEFVPRMRCGVLVALPGQAAVVPPPLAGPPAPMIFYNQAGEQMQQVVDEEF